MSSGRVWVVVQETPYEESTVHGVYATKQLADLAAFHPYAPLTVMEFPLVEPSAPVHQVAETPRDQQEADK